MAQPVELPSKIEVGPVIDEGHSLASVSDKIAGIVLKRKITIGWVFGFLIAFGVMQLLMGARHLADHQGRRHLGHQHPDRLGIRDRQLRLVDRYRPRRHADLGDSSSAQSVVAQRDQPLRRSHDDFRRACARACSRCCIPAVRGWLTGCCRIRTRCGSGRSSAARWCGTCSRFRRT